MQYFDFSGLIEKYASTFTVLSSEEVYDDFGELQISTTGRTCTGALFAVSESKIYRSDGVLTAKDKELYMLESLGEISNTFVVFEGEKYKVETSPQNNPDFTGVWAYTLKRVSAFDTKEGTP